MLRCACGEGLGTRLPFSVSPNSKTKPVREDKTEAESESEGKTEVESESEGKTEVEPEVEPETEGKTETESETDSKLEGDQLWLAHPGLCFSDRSSRLSMAK